MARILGVGGVFFKSPDTRKLIEWYQKHLGVPVQDGPGVSFLPDAIPKGGYTVWSPFKQNTDYFNPARKEFMFNLMVDDLDGALRQVRQGGAEVVGAIEEYDFGRFGWFMDPDGNKVELWEPRVEKGSEK